MTKDLWDRRMREIRTSGGMRGEAAVNIHDEHSPSSTLPISVVLSLTQATPRMPPAECQKVVKARDESQKIREHGAVALGLYEVSY